MKFAVLVYVDEAAWAAQGPQELETLLGETFSLVERWTEAGVLAPGGARLAPPWTAGQFVSPPTVSASEWRVRRSVPSRRSADSSASMPHPSMRPKHWPQPGRRLSALAAQSRLEGSTSADLTGTRVDRPGFAYATHIANDPAGAVG
jgi:hypothetical protein